MKTKKIINPLPYPYYFWTVMGIALIGLFALVYLAISHYRNYVDIGYQSFCAISSAINCDTVSQSPYSIFLNVPVPIWGIMAHAFFIALLLLAYPGAGDRRRMWTLLMFIALGFSVYCIVLAGLSTFMIQSYCIMCILGYSVCFFLLYYTWMVRNRFEGEKITTALCLDFNHLLNFPRTSLTIMTGFSAVMLAIFLFIPQYWHLTPPAITIDMNHGVTEEGHPWIGAENPELVITEFSDYFCFACKKNHYYLRRIIQKHPDKIRLVHRHFPMDHTINPIVTEPFHIGSAKLAILTIYATGKGKFWEVNDLLFNIARQSGGVGIRVIAEKTGLDFEETRYSLQDNALWQKLLDDIRDGLQYGISATPGYVINDQLYVGHIPPDLLKDYL